MSICRIVAPVLFVDATSGLTCAGLVAALVDLGAPPSPILHAVAGLEREAELRFEPTAGGTHAIVLGRESFPGDPGEAAAAVALADLPPGAFRTVERVMRILSAAVAPLPLRAPADSILQVAGAAAALDGLAISRVLFSRIEAGSDPSSPVLDLLDPFLDGVDFSGPDAEATSPAAAALARALVPPGAIGGSEPVWSGFAAGGTGRLGPGRGNLRVALGVP